MINLKDNFIKRSLHRNIKSLIKLQSILYINKTFYLIMSAQNFQFKVVLLGEGCVGNKVFDVKIVQFLFYQF